MITHIRTSGFKGFDIAREMSQKMIFTGKNRTGKTTHSQIIAIVIYGFVPWSTAGKRPADILDSFGDGKELICFATIDGKEFGRKFTRNNKGIVSQGFQYDGKRTNANNFNVLLAQAGAPKIADVAAFMSQSEAKKVETLLNLYPNPELSGIDQEIETAKEDISRINKKIDGADSTIKRLTESKGSYKQTAGSISEIQAEIKSISDQIADVEKQIHDAEIAEAKQRAAEQARRQELERIKQEQSVEIDLTADNGFNIPKKPDWASGDDCQETPLKIEADWKAAGIDNIPDSPQMQEADGLISGMEKQMEDFDKGNVADDKAKMFLEPVTQPDKSIKRIIYAMQQTGCSTCAALIVAKRELKKYE